MVCEGMGYYWWVMEIIIEIGDVAARLNILKLECEHSYARLVRNLT